MITRRDFLKSALAGLTLAATCPDLAWGSSKTERQPILVAVHLTGGNDALNTLVPFRDQVYRAQRPHLALPSKELLTISDDLAFHPKLANLCSRYEKGEVLLLPGIGRPDHDRSHFRASDLWHSAGHPDGHGWMATLAAQQGSRPVSLGDTVSRAVACPGHPPLGILGRGLPEFPGSVALEKAWSGMMSGWTARHPAAQQLKSSAKMVEELADRLAVKMDAVNLKCRFADDDFGRRFETVARMVAAEFPSRLYHIGAGKFDTHSEQLHGHANELASLDAGLEAFLANLSGLGYPVVVMVYSEFGRRVGENLSGGTDHGAGGLAWMVGPSVKGGVKGNYGLQQLDDGDLKVSLDYRELYRSAVTASFGSGVAKGLFAPSPQLS